MTGHDRQAGLPADEDGGSPTLSRRAAIGLGAALVAGAALGPQRAGATTATAAPGAAGSATAASDTAGSAVDLLRPEITPRDGWGADLATGPILPEEDVRFLLVHHTASTNDYGPADVVDQIRDFHAFHTGPEKGWPDVAYNFFVDRFGGIWEARAGSLAGPVRGDATGGSQGFALLCSLIGDHSQAALTDPARESLTRLLAWLAERHDVDTEPGATVEFVSRGSNRWPQGATVTAATISGHRDMSQTTCPGDFAYYLLDAEIPRVVTDLRLQARDSLATTTTAAVPTTDAPTTVPSSTTSSTDRPGPSEEAAADLGDDDSAVDTIDVVVGGVAALGAAGLAAGALRNRRRQT